MKAALKTLSDKRLILVTGKGGTGKSVVASILALQLAAEGKRVHLVELGRRQDFAFSRLHELLGVSNLQHNPISIPILGKGSLQASRLDPSLSLAEYVALKLPGGVLAGMLLKNKVTASLLEIVPGLVEIVSLGKLWHSLKRKADGPEIVIIDGPASGHAATLLQSPANFARLTKVGPLYRDSRQMQDFLLDDEQTEVVFVSIPELMSLEEAQEFSEVLSKHTKSVSVYINKIWPLASPSPKNSATWAIPALKYREDRAKREAETVKEAAASGLGIAASVPFFFVSPEKIVAAFESWLENE